ncbi:MAG TPA: type VI secretion system protein [Telluria sp.]|jgi:type VI secretion system protein ImpL
MLNFLSDNVAIATLLLVTVLVLVLLAAVMSAALRGAAPPGAADKAGAMRLLGSESLRQSFHGAIELIEANLAPSAKRYDLSWTLLLNEGSGADVPLLQCGLHSALSADSSQSAAALGMTWNFFDEGVVVQLQAASLGSPDPDSAAQDGIWNDFLGLCARYRPQRPFDGIVLALPCALLLADEAQGQLELVARAKSISRRLWLAQNRLALRFPVHVMLTGCEVLPGFASFGAALPEALRRSILGWASPYELVAPFQVQWIDTAMDQVVGAVADGCAELCALEPAGADSSAYFLLPREVERLRAGLTVFCEELMRPSAYHEPFLLRGIYLTGDASDTAALLANGAGPPDASLGQGEESAAADAGPREGMPVFLRDIFERKIFPEAGLVQSASKRLKHTARQRLAYWPLLLAPGLWAVGLVMATFQLHYLADQVLGDLKALNGEARAGGADGSNGRQRSERAVAALLNIEQLGAERFRSIFMPGSWQLFSNLHEQMQERLEQGFAEHAFVPLRQAAYAQLGQLTGVPLDPATGSLIAGAQCTLPARWTEAGQAVRALDLEDMPHYLAMLRYLARLDELEHAVGAMQRLAGPEVAPAAGEDLALAVRVLLGAELNGRPTRTAALFRQVAQGMAPLAVEPMQQAARCALRQASQSMYQGLFDDNVLLRAERAVSASSAALLDSTVHGADFAAQLRPWQALRGALDEQHQHLAAGKGAWMHRTSVDLGPVHQAMLARIGANTLLGTGAADDTRRMAAQGFERFAKAWGDSVPAFGQGGLAWDEASAGWTFTPERKALREAVTGLMAQPYMLADAPARLAEVAPGSSVSWDKTQLERAGALTDARKAFQGGAQARLPAALQQAASALVDQALVARVHAALAQAMSVAPATLPSAAADAERAGVLRLRTWLDELGARQLGAEIDAVLTRDALSRLQRLDEVFTAADVFVPRERNFQGWKGEKGALLDAFAAADAAALGGYLAQQLEFIDVAARQSEGVLAQLNGTAAAHPVVTRWQAIQADLRRYRLKSPASSLIAVEQFIQGSAEIEIANCADKLGERLAQRRGADLFSERLHSLQSALLARCRDLTAGQYRTEWERFAEVYNRDLGQRAPFATPAAGTDGSAPAAADHDDVGAAMKLYDRARAASVLAERDPARPAAGAAVRRADQQLRVVREVLAPLYPAEAGQAGGLDVTAQFRANPGAEAEANKIIDWSLNIGAATVRLGEPVRALRWEPGMPVLLTLRMARDGLGVPRAEPGHPNMRVAERTVSYRFDDPWALFTFIGAYRDNEAAGDGRAPLLRFEFPVQGTGALAATASRARVFLRLSVSAPGKRTPLAWPAVFPAQAPAWQDAVLAADDPRRPPAQAGLGQ